MDQHPDLVDIGRRLRDRLEDTLDAELAAARASAARRRTVRDLLLEAEDAGRAVIAATVEGGAYAGRLAAVGADHVLLLRSDGGTVAIVLDAVTAIEVAP
jgi:hypothetical protein